MNTSPIRVGACILAGLLAWAAGYAYSPVLDSRTALGPQRIPDYAPPAAADAGLRLVAPDGKALYANACQSCHQPSGNGLGKVFPPLAGTARVQGDIAPLALIVLHGMTGATQVNGITYHGVMPGFRDQFSDQELAALLSYIRNAWGNTASPVTPDAIAQWRAASAQRHTPWDGDADLRDGLSAAFPDIGTIPVPASPPQAP